MSINGKERLYVSEGNGVASVSVQDIADFVGSSGATTVTAAQISDASTVGRSVLTAADMPTARTAIGAGTSNLAIGTTASTALAGNALLPQASPADLSAAPTAADFNGLLAKLKAAKVLT